MFIVQSRDCESRGKGRLRTNLRWAATWSVAILSYGSMLHAQTADIAQRSSPTRRPFGRDVIVEPDGQWTRTRFLPRGVLKPPTDFRHINPGDPTTAERHYDDAAIALGLSNKEAFGRLDQLLALAGYAGLTAENLADLDSARLMDPAGLQSALGTAKGRLADLQAGEILATRFFSPKTTDVSGKQQPREYSWRKLIRLRVRPSSTAAQRGFLNLWVLTNSYEADLGKNPFLAADRNFQAILQPDVKQVKPLPMFFFAFGALPDATRSVSSQGSWDAGNETLGEHDVHTAYHAPTACMDCHGRDTKFPRLQYLDTDHWLDRVQAKDDFPLVGRSNWSALFDAGKDPQDQQFSAAFEVVRQLNREILTQNQSVDALATRESADPKLSHSLRRAADAALQVGFQTRAADNWLRLHASSSAHIPPAQRGILGEDGTTKWDAANRDEARLVGLLNRFCFRCHSSVEFHVFDKQAIREVQAMFAYHLDEKLPHDQLRMPQDRGPNDPVFTPKTRAEIISLAERIFDRPLAAAVLNNTSPDSPDVKE